MAEYEQRFGSDYDWSDFTKQSGSDAVELTNYLNFGDSTLKTWYRYKTGKQIIPGETVLAINLRVSNNQYDSDAGGGFIYVKVGGTYYLAGSVNHLGDEYFSYAETTSISLDTAFWTKTTLTVGSYKWIALKFNSDYSISIAGASSTTTFPTSPVPTSWTTKASAVMNYSSLIIEEIGFISAWTVTTANKDVDIAWIDAIWTDISNTVGGAASLKNIISITATKSINGGGGAIITCDTDDDLSDQLLNDIVIYDETYGNVLFKGILKEFSRDAKYITFKADELIRQLREIPCDTNPIVWNSQLLHSTEGLIRDPYSSWTTDTYKNKYAVCVKSDKYNVYAEITSRTFWRVANSNIGDGTWSSYTPDYEEGFYYRLYFDDENLSNHHAICGAIDYDEMSIEYDFKTYIQEGSSPDRILLDLALSTRARKDSAIHGTDDNYRPKIYFWHYGDSAFRKFEVLSKTKYSVAEEDPDLWEFGYLKQGASYETVKAPKLTLSLDVANAKGISISDFLTDYVSKGTADANGYQTWEMKVAISSGSPNLGAFENGLEIYKCKLKFENLDTKQFQYTDNSVVASNGANSITFSDSYPVNNAISEGDELIITDTYENTLDDVFSALSDFVVDSDITCSKAVKTDITYMTVYDYIAKLCDLENAIFYDNSDETTNTIVLRENLTSSGVTLTSADIVNFNDGGYQLSKDSSNIKTKIVVVGFDDTVTLTAGVDYSIEKSPSIGDSVVVYNNKELDSYSEVLAFAQSMIYRHKNMRYTVTLELDYENGAQDYSNLEVGKTVSLKLPSVADTSIIDKTLLIESIQMIQDETTGFEQRIILNLASREV